jgi:transporter family-2 protein
MICFIVAALALVLYLPFSKETLSWAGLKSASILSLIGGGVLGTVFITSTTIALPRLGMALTFGLVVAGQVVISVLLDHFNIMVVQQHSINVWRVIGVALIIGGVIIVQKF